MCACRPCVAGRCCYVVAAVLSAVSWTAADFAPDEKPDLREVFREKRCLPLTRQPLYNFAKDRVWVLEANEWASHRLTTLIAAILLREHAGYGVDINLVPSGSGVYGRLAKDEVSGRAAMELSSIGKHFGYVNLEVWPDGQRGAHLNWVAKKGIVQDMGYVGYDGRSGWFVSETFARNPRFPISPEFYRAYDNTTYKGRPVWATLLNNGTRVRCDRNATCWGGSASSCPSDGISDLFWCPSKDSRVLPTVLASSPTMDQGFNEEIARSNNFQFGIHYTGLSDFSEEAALALASNNDIAQIVHTWKPSLFLTRIGLRGQRPVRLMLPSEDCGHHTLDGTGNWSCDFPSQALNKMSSADIMRDPIINHFFKSFSLGSGGLRGSDAVALGDLEGAGMQELLTKLALRLPLNNMSTIAKSSDIFDTACAWILSNEVEGAAWNTWIQPRDVPIFADTVSAWYPYPLLLVMLAGSFAFIVFIEFPWLSTTFLPKEKNRILSRSKTGQCRTELEMGLRGPLPSIEARPTTTNEAAAGVVRQLTSFKQAADDKERKGRLGFSTPKHLVKFSSDTTLCNEYWKGLLETAMSKTLSQTFWNEVEAWITNRKYSNEPAEEECRPSMDIVSLAHHTIPCFSKDGSVAIPLRRQAAANKGGEELDVEVIVEECIGGAKKGKDFEAGKYKVHFAKGQEYAVFSVKVKYHQDLWQNSVWFVARLGGILKGEAMLATPDEATVLILDDDRFPANIPEHKRGGWGISLMRYFIRADRLRRGRNWTKTMIAMCWLPVHSVFVSTLVQKALVDHTVHSVLNAHAGADLEWFYWEVLVLAGVQFLSLGLNRWADVVQTRCRGRTGGVRQVHRGELLKKFMHMEHSEHWLASDASWLYSTIYDADVITGEAYFQVFLLAQSIVGLALSVLLVIILVLWTWLQTRHDMASAQGPTFGSFGYILGVLVIIPTGLFGVFARGKLIWVAVIARKEWECAWFSSCTWIISSWRFLNGFSSQERAALVLRVEKQNKDFIPAHWDMRDTMNDTAWIAHWLQGVSYSVMLVFGTFALCDYLKYGIGTMEVGTFYALCTIYLSVGKYLGMVSGVFVAMQRAIVSLREIAALLNQADQRSQRRDARLWGKLARTVGRVGMKHDTVAALQGQTEDAIVFADGLTFVRPPTNKVGSFFSELKLKEIAIPLGEIVFVTAHNERVLRSFLGLASKIIHPTTARGEELPLDQRGVSIPQGLKVMMLPTGSVRMGATAPKIIEQLEFTGAPRELCMALIESCGLDPERETASLGMGSAQVFSIIRALLMDPDVLCTFRPLALVPVDVRKHMGFLLRMWQGAGGLPAIATHLGTRVLNRSKSNPEKPVWRSSKRTLIVGNPEDDIWGGWVTDKRIDLEKYLWKDEDDFASVPSSDHGEFYNMFERQSSRSRIGRPMRQDFLDVYGGA